MRRSWFRALAGIRHTPGLFVASTLSVTTSIFLVGAFYLAGENLKRWTSDLLGAGTLVVYFEADIDAAKAKVLEGDLARLPGVRKVSLISPSEAAGQLDAILGSGTSKAEGRASGAKTNAKTSANLFSWAAEVAADEQSALPDLAASISAWPGVDEADFGEDLFARVDTLARVVDVLGVALMALVVFVCAFVVNMTVSLALFLRREEIQIQKIIGASDTFVMVPLLVEAFLEGVLGGLLALALLYASWHTFGARAAPALSRLGLDEPFFLGSPSALWLIGAGVFIGVLGTLVAATRHLGTIE